MTGDFDDKSDIKFSIELDANELDVLFALIGIVATGDDWTKKDGIKAATFHVFNRICQETGHSPDMYTPDLPCAKTVIQAAKMLALNGFMGDPLPFAPKEEGGEDIPVEELVLAAKKEAERQGLV